MELSEQRALTELLHCQDLYALQPQHLADYHLDKLRVTMGDILPKDVVDLESTSLAEVLQHPCSSMLWSCAEMLHLEESVISLTSVFCRHLESSTCPRFTFVVLGAMFAMDTINSRTIA